MTKNAIAKVNQHTKHTFKIESVLFYYYFFGI